MPELPASISVEPFGDIVPIKLLLLADGLFASEDYSILKMMTEMGLGETKDTYGTLLLGNLSLI